MECAEKSNDSGEFFPRGGRGSAALGAWLAVLQSLVVLGCGGEPASAPSQPLAAIDLVAALPSAFVETDLAGLPFRGAGERRYLTSGWHRFEESSKGQGFAWTKGRTAVVEVPVASPGPLLVRMRVDPGRRAPSLPAQRVALVWNGEIISQAKLAWRSQVLQFNVPESLQRTGMNRLEVRPHFWFDASHVYRIQDRRTLGLKVVGIEFLRRRHELAALDDATPVVAEGGTLVQRPGSVVQFFATLPASPRLRAAVALAPGTAAEALALVATLAGDGVETRADWAVQLLDEGGGEHELARGALAEVADAPIELDLDLGAWARQPVGISLSVSVSAILKRRASPPAALETTPLVIWDAPRVEGGQAPSVASAGAERRPYNVLVVLFDTLRSDHLPAYGNPEVRTPRINELAQSGVLFLNALANASWTRPAVASILTGTYPSAHLTEVMKTDSLPASISFLPALLKERGYRTVSVVNNANVDSSFGFGRGFDHVYPIYERERELERLETAADRASLVWNDTVAPHIEGDAPFFVYLHEIDPHAPYGAPAPFGTMYLDDDYSGYIGNNGYNKLVNGGIMSLDAQDVGYLNDLYKGEITFMDGYLGWVLDELERTDRRKDTLVVFLSDHGEEFNEHGGIKHGRSLYEHQVRVPLVLSLPGVLPAGERIRATAEQVDMVPTILDLIGADVPADVQGRSLLPVIESGGREAPRPSFAKVGREGVDGTAWNSVRVGDIKLVRQRFKAGTQRFMIFDLATDPGEKNDLWPVRFTLGQTLRQQLEAHELRSAQLAAGFEAGGAAEMDGSVRKNLRALGYIE